MNLLLAVDTLRINTLSSIENETMRLISHIILASSAVCMPLALAWMPHSLQLTPPKQRSITRLSVHQSPIPEQDNTTTKEFLFPWSKDKGSIRDQADILKSAGSPQNEGMSPALMGAGAVAAFATIMAGLSTATHLDFRYVY